jgi:hypothetical protein
MSRITAEEAVAGPPPVDDAMLERLLTTARRERRRDRHRRVLAAAAAVVVLAGGTAGGVAAYRHATATHWQSIAASSGAVHMRVELAPSSAGTSLTLWLSGVQGVPECRLVAVSDTGAREVTSSWDAGYTGSAVVKGTTAIDRSHLRKLVVERFDGVPLVTADIPAA